MLQGLELQIANLSDLSHEIDWWSYFRDGGPIEGALTELFDHFFQLIVLACQTFVFGLILFSGFFVALNGWERDRGVEWRIQSIKIAKEMGDLLFEWCKFYKIELIFLRFDVVYDLKVDFLKDYVELVQDFFLDLEKYVLVYLSHFKYIICQRIIRRGIREAAKYTSLAILAAWTCLNLKWPPPCLQLQLYSLRRGTHLFSASICHL